MKGLTLYGLSRQKGTRNDKMSLCVKLERLPGSKLHYKTRLDSSRNLRFANLILPVSVLNPIPNIQDC